MYAIYVKWQLATRGKLNVMRRHWKAIVGFALLGVAVAAGAHAYAAFFAYSKPTTGLDVALTIVPVVLCPPQLIFGFCIDSEVIGWNGGSLLPAATDSPELILAHMRRVFFYFRLWECVNGF